MGKAAWVLLMLLVASVARAQPIAGWDPFAFPVRTARTYRQPPREGAGARMLRCEPYLVEAAQRYQLPVSYLRAIVRVESNFDPLVVSVDGAVGLMQLMPFTARKMGVTDPFDPRQNILGGARFLRVLANQWQGDLVRTTASYNAGAGAVAKYAGVPPYGETQRYVQRVLAWFHAYARGVAVETRPTRP